ncbi:MAG TPA: hypothetical protein PLP17_11510, partial [Oligoflexia bacterium]|nr:hypothetical protein [Oligoflexia bacterium]
FSFAFAKELRNPTRGITHATSNTYDPQAMGYLVPNWLEVINLDSVARVFQYNLYDQEGRKVLTRSFALPALGEWDIQAGHEIVGISGKVIESVYLTEIIPLDGATKYFATVSRYSSNAKAGVEPDTYNFAFALDGRAGNGATQYVTISNAVGARYLQTNWVEVVNTLPRPVTATLTFRGFDGKTLNTVSQLINAKAQFHFNAGALLPKGESGSVELNCSDRGALIAQSLVYYHDNQKNKVQTAYASQGRIAGRDVQAGSINTFLGMTDQVKLLSTTQGAVTVVAELRTFEANAQVKTTTIRLNGLAAAAASTATGSALATPSDRYGALTIRAGQADVIAAEVLRERITSEGVVDFAFPTVVQ